MKSAQRNSYIWKTTCFSLAECVLAHPLCITKVTLWHSLKAIQLKKIIWSLSNGVPTFTIVPHLRHSFAQTLYSVLCYLPHQRILFCSECPLSISYFKKKLSYRSYNALISNQYELIGKKPEYVYLCGLWVHPPINSNTRSFIFRRKTGSVLASISFSFVHTVRCF